MNKTNIFFAQNQGPRDNLEDDLSASQISLPNQETEIAVFGVYDGVGSIKGGHIASYLAAQTVLTFLVSFFLTQYQKVNKENTQAVLQDNLKKALELANQAILQQSAEQTEWQGMATTAVVVIVFNRTCYVAWLGDSRCYLYHRNELKQITTDHSEVQLLIDAGLIDLEDAKNHPLAHTIHRYLGQNNNFKVDTRICPLSPGDIILLATDGLTDVVLDEEITAHIQRYTAKEIPFTQLPETLVQQALRAGTHDNVTVLCCQYEPIFVGPSPLSELTKTNEYYLTLAQFLSQPTKEVTHGFKQ